MKTKRHNLIAVTLVLLTMLFVSAVYSMAAQSQPVSSKKELKALLATANTPAEHLRIAAYYRDKAQRLTASSTKHSELAAIYAKNPPFPAIESKHGIAFAQGAPHCRYWAKLEADEATKAEAIAVRHEEMARTAEQK